MTVNEFIEKLKQAVGNATVETGRDIGKSQINIEGFSEFYFDYEEQGVYPDTLIVTGKI